MNKKSIYAIENIIISINELMILTKDKDVNYFYDSYEMPILCELVNDVNKSISKINSKVKKKYSFVNWEIINQFKEDDNGVKILNLGKVWDLASNLLEKQLYQNMMKILKLELPVYYKNYSIKKHNKKINN